VRCRCGRRDRALSHLLLKRRVGHDEEVGGRSPGDLLLQDAHRGKGEPDRVAGVSLEVFREVHDRRLHRACAQDLDLGRTRRNGSAYHRRKEQSGQHPDHPGCRIAPPLPAVVRLDELIRFVKKELRRRRLPLPWLRTARASRTAARPVHALQDLVHILPAVARR
jgi:hypothetical protein